MPDDRDERLWLARLRWRLRGAWQGPAFVVLTAAEAALLRWLPFSGDKGLDLIGGVLLAGFFNLAICAVVGPLGAWLLRRRRPTLPVEIARDKTATAFMAGLAVLLLAGGIGHRGSVADADADHERQLAAVRAWVAHHAGPEFQAGARSPSTYKLAEDSYRTCVVGDEPGRELCLYVRTDQAQPIVRRDPSQEPNSVLAGPDNPGRSGR